MGAAVLVVVFVGPSDEIPGCSEWLCWLELLGAASWGARGWKDPRDRVYLAP